MKQDNNHRKEEVTTARIEDIESMLSLNDKIYPKEWHVSPAYIKEIMLRNPEVYKIVKTSAGVKGIYGLFPLNKEDYTAVLEGKLEEDEVGEFILDYTHPTTVYLYFVTLIVDIHDARRKEYAGKLIKDIPLELKRLKEKGMDIKEIGAFAVSAEGEKVLPKIGFVHSGEKVVLSDKEYPVFRAKLENVIHTIKI
jgi:predicted house-cleaning noncanonical NTP pyrophosphatase (MazG superfamily)